MSTRNFLVLAAVATLGLADATQAANLTAGMQQGKVELKSAGPATFAPQGVLLIGDTQNAMLYAIATNDKASGTSSQPFRVERIDEKIAGMLGTTADGILINDMAVNPETGSTFLTVSRGRGPDAKPVILRIDSNGSLSEFSLDNVLHSKAPIPTAPQGKQRQDVTTDLQFTDGRVLVAGLSNEEFASQLRVLPFPFAAVDKGTSIEIFHGSHGRFETKSPIRTFAVFEIGGQPNVLAAYTCTPLVKFPLAALTPGSKIKGTTVAELGNHNRPLDMVVYEKGGKEYLLMANSARGLMKIDLSNVESADGITDRIKDTAGLPYETIKEPTKVDQLDRLDKQHAMLLVKSDAGGLNLIAYELP